ncbi:hypothetical protein [Rufibacter sp. XAAS-G3-1]|uniref:hypothetical protein n=1 Tax=Rufibacter sp. XAAS-G3-1 TaxID=2729134 RepID=UPI0015E7AC68|nr:hypothetical protein [Rufibacter sp. XAAS-G3-1]
MYPVRLYQQATQTESHLFNGPQYVDYRRQMREGHQFFLQDAAATGNVHYDGASYDQVPMLYDLVKDEVIIMRNNLLMQKLVSEKVASFELNGHRFVRHVAPQSADSSSLPTGFYDVLHDGTSKMLVKRQKQMEEKVEDKFLIEIYSHRDKFFLGKEKTFYQVRSKKSVYQLLKDKKKELKKYARSNKLRFRKQREEGILALITYYDTLRNQ